MAKKTLALVGRIAREHKEEMCAPLNPAERDTLAQVLGRIAEQQPTPGVHPGYTGL